MEFPANLVSDSRLVQATLDFIIARGGRVRISEIAEAVFRLTHSGEELATALVSDLIADDPRFVIEDHCLSIHEDDSESRPLNEIDFIVLDVEALAPRPAPARIIELAAYRVRAGQILAEFQALINPGVPLSPFIAQLTGISNQMLEAAPTFADLVSDWLKFAGNGVLVAHNSDFDVPLLNQEIARVYPGRRMRNSEVCTVKLARRLISNSSGHNLDALADHFGFEIPERHRAASDARATVRVLLHLLEELNKHHVNTLAEARSFRVSPASSRDAEPLLALDV